MDTEWFYRAAICSDTPTQPPSLFTKVRLLEQSHLQQHVMLSSSFHFVVNTSVLFTCHASAFHIWIGLNWMESLGRNSWIYECVSACERTKVVAAGQPIGRRFPSDGAL